MKRSAAILLTVVLMLLMCIAASATPAKMSALPPQSDRVLAKQPKPEFKVQSARIVRDSHPFLTEFVGPAKGEAKK